jgi:RNA polymerase sigma-70 factor (ECF subfamily)
MALHAPAAMSAAARNASTSRPDGLFATTLWTVVLKAGGAETTQARSALERLCQSYWYPLYAHARRRGHSPHDAHDLVQGFFADLIERSPFQQLSPDKGRFRSFLLAALNNFMADEWDRRNAAMDLLTPWSETLRLELVWRVEHFRRIP